MITQIQNVIIKIKDVAPLHWDEKAITDLRKHFDAVISNIPSNDSHRTKHWINEAFSCLSDAGTTYTGAIEILTNHLENISK